MINVKNAEGFLVVFWSADIIILFLQALRRWTSHPLILDSNSNNSLTTIVSSYLALSSCLSNYGSFGAIGKNAYINENDRKVRHSSTTTHQTSD
jgi:hypothetical protein